MKLPKRWLVYNKSARIKNTPFVACKTPLREGFSTVLSPTDSFTPKNLLMHHPRIGLVIDLSYTTKYYNGDSEFVKNGVKYVKLGCPGHGCVPSENQFQEFVNVVENFLRLSPNHHLIAVHCTHGVNRTGYFIVRYMIEKMNYIYEEALKKNDLQCRILLNSHLVSKKNLTNGKYLFGNLRATLKASFSTQVSKNKVAVALLTGLDSGKRMFITVTQHNQPIGVTKSPITHD